MLFNVFLFGQEEKLEIEGAIQIGNSEDLSPDAGTIRWTGADFEGWNGLEWLSLTGKPLTVDIDGNEFDTVHIGTQVWMKENLRVTKYNDGTAIDLVTDNGEWFGLSTGAYCWYDNNGVAYEEVYGKLYNGYAVSSGKLCPSGWHVPTDAEWTILTDFLGGTSVAGHKMREAGTEHWGNPNTGATNESEWTGLPGGRRVINGTFNSIKLDGVWWSSTNNSSQLYNRQLEESNQNVIRAISSQRNGGSVRCIKN